MRSEAIRGKISDCRGDEGVAGSLLKGKTTSEVSENVCTPGGSSIQVLLVLERLESGVCLRMRCVRLLVPMQNWEGMKWKSEIYRDHRENADIVLHLNGPSTLDNLI